MRLTVLFLALCLGYNSTALAEAPAPSLIVLDAEDTLKNLTDGVSHLVIDVRSAFGKSLVEEWMHENYFASVDPLDQQPFVLVVPPNSTSASGWEVDIFREDGSFNEDLSEQFVFRSSSSLKEVLDDVLERYKTHNVYLVLSASSFQRLSKGILPRLCKSTWQRSMAFAHRHKWTILPTAALAAVGSIWWYNYRSGGGTVYSEYDKSNCTKWTALSDSLTFEPLLGSLPTLPDTMQEVGGTLQARKVDPPNEGNVIERILRGDKTTQALEEKNHQLDKLVPSGKEHEGKNLGSDVPFKPLKVDLLDDVITTQRGIREYKTKQTLKKREQVATDIQRKRIFREHQTRHASRGYFPELIRVEKSKRLGSAEMRGFIGSQWMEHLEGFQPSNSIFIRGGVKKPTFFWRKNDVDARKTYIVPANDYEANDKDIKYVQSGEQGISIVLSNVKRAIEQEHNYDSTLLIPLQQLDKSHWVLLEVVLRQRHTKIDAITSTGRCYDSKHWVSMSNIIDNFTGKARVDYVNKVVKDTFGITAEWIWEGTQPLLDDYNCGRYTLIKMGALLQLTNAPKTIDDINKILSPNSIDETQTCDGKAAEDLSSIARDSVSSDDSSDWEPVS